MESIRVLIIDDEPAILETLSMIFALEPDFFVETLEDVSQWRERITAFRPDVVLVDYRMPSMNADVFIRQLNASGLRPAIHTVGIFSATPFSPDEIQRMGADLYFEKPFVIEHLVARLREVAHSAQTPSLRKMSA